MSRAEFAKSMFDFDATEMRTRALRGGIITLTTQGVKLVLRLASIMILSRLLTPADFGLVAMVTAITGVVELFKDAGLSAATVQREEITGKQVSTLFWINVGLSVALTLILLLVAPLIAGLYSEPRLTLITIVLAGGFIMSGLTVQHQALLRRHMRYGTLGVIEIASQGTSVLVACLLAFFGFGYWSLVLMPVIFAFTNMLGVWIALPWRPGPPKKDSGVLPFLVFGGNLAAFSVVNYIAKNADRVLIGWYSGATSLGLYQRAYSLLMLPINQVNKPISSVAVATLSRLQKEPLRLRRYFVSGYSALAAMVVPIVCTMVVFTDELIAIALGPQWSAAVSIFRLLGVAALIGALMNPLGWLYIATGRPHRQLRFGAVATVALIVAFASGLRYGPDGVAAAFSVCLSILFVPGVLYATHGTPVRGRDVFRAVRYPLLAATIATVIGMLFRHWTPNLHLFIRGAAGPALLLGSYALVLLFVLRQWPVYRDFIKRRKP